VELQTGGGGGASVGREGKGNFRGVKLLEWVGVGSRTKRGKILRNMPVAILATVCRCRVERSSESSTRPR